MEHPDDSPHSRFAVRALIASVALVTVYGLFKAAWILVPSLLVLYLGVILAVGLRGAATWIATRTPLGVGPALGLVILAVFGTPVAAGFAIAPALSDQVDEAKGQLPALQERLDGWLSHVELQVQTVAGEGGDTDKAADTDAKAPEDTDAKAEAESKDTDAKEKSGEADPDDTDAKAKTKPEDTEDTEDTDAKSESTDAKSEGTDAKAKSGQPEDTDATAKSEAEDTDASAKSEAEDTDASAKSGAPDAKGAGGEGDPASGGGQATAAERLSKSKNIFEWVGTFVGGVGQAVGGLAVVSIVGIYLALTPKTYEYGLVALVPLGSRPRVRVVLADLAALLRAWIIAQLIAMTVVFIVTTIALTVIGMPMALLLGVIAGVLDFIPNFGPLAAGAPAALIAAGEGKVGPVIAIYVAIQVLEGWVLRPLIESKAVDTPPALLIAGQLLLGTLVGFMGLLLAPALLVTFTLLIQRFYVEDGLGDRPPPEPDQG